MKGSRIRRLPEKDRKSDLPQALASVLSGSASWNLSLLVWRKSSAMVIVFSWKVMKEDVPLPG
jgi:hypothetical protein